MIQGKQLDKRRWGIVLTYPDGREEILSVIDGAVLFIREELEGGAIYVAALECPQCGLIATASTKDEAPEDLVEAIAKPIDCPRCKYSGSWKDITPYKRRLYLPPEKRIPPAPANVAPPGDDPEPPHSDERNGKGKKRKVA